MPHATRGGASRTMVHTARELRRIMTPAEEKLWEVLRGRRLAGLKFRRQHPFDRFILDFFCVEKQLVIELDGAVHAQPDQASHDEERTEWLNAHEIRVLRFKNEEIENDLGGVLRKIVEVASSPRPPSPESKQRDSGEGGVRSSADDSSPSPDDASAFRRQERGQGGEA